MSIWYWEAEDAITLFMWVDAFEAWYFYDCVADQWFPGKPVRAEVWIGAFE